MVAKDPLGRAILHLAVIDATCLSALLGAAETFRGRGGGVNVVLFPGSALANRLAALAPVELPAYDNATAAVVAFSDGH